MRITPTGVVVARGDRGQQPQAYIPSPEELEALGTVLATGWKAGRSVVEHYRNARAAKAHTALTVSVVRSELTDAHGYRLDFRFRNGTPHGAYVEKLFLLDPQAKDFELRLLEFTTHNTPTVNQRAPGPPIALGAKAPATRVGLPPRDLPVFIEPGGEEQLTVLVKPDAKLWFDRASVGIGTARVSCLGEDAPQQIAWRFHIRKRETEK